MPTTTDPQENIRQLDSMRAEGFGDPGRSIEQIDRRRALEGVVAVEADGNDATVPVMYGQTVRVGSLVSHARQRMGRATARVIGFEVDLSGNFRYPWVKVVIEHIDASGQATDKVEEWNNNRWDWDRVEAERDA